MNAPILSLGLKRLLPSRGDESRLADAPRGANLQASALRAEAPPRPTPAQQRQRLSAAFTPTRPQFLAEARPGLHRAGRRLIGREAEVARILRSLREDQAHVVLYGGRGQGKTSLANAVAAEARRSGMPVARCVCSASSDFDSILRSLARDLPPGRIGAEVAADAGGTGSEGVLPASPLQPGDIFALVPRLPEVRLILLVDEFDRITSQATRTAFADMLKQVSDRGAALSFLLIGVSDSLEQIIGQHPSIQRCVAGVPLRLLTRDDVEALVLQGGAASGMEFPPAARASIAALARGVPYVAQLLALRAAQSALDSGRSVIQGGDLAAAITAAVDEADPRIVSQYDMLTRAGRDAAMVALLRAAAGGQWDAFGRFRAVRQREPGLLRVAGTPTRQATWQQLLGTGAVRVCSDTRQELFTFDEALLPHYILLRAVRDARGG